MALDNYLTASFDRVPPTGSSAMTKISIDISFITFCPAAEPFSAGNGARSARPLHAALPTVVKLSHPIFHVIFQNQIRKIDHNTIQQH